MQTRTTALALLLLLSFPAESMAQATTPPDIVRLRDGAFVRGTIIERDSSRVVVMLPTGESRTYDAAQVAYAGPEERPPTAPASPAPTAGPASAQPGTIHLRVLSDQENLSLQRLTGSTTVTVATQNGVGTAIVDQFGVVCNAPCEIDMPAGTFQLGVAQGTGGAVRAGPPMDLRRDTTLHIAYDDRTALRVIGWLTFGVGLAGSLGLSMAGIFIDSYGADVPLYVSAGVVGGVGIIVGMILAFMFDAADVRRVDAEGIRF